MIPASAEERMFRRFLRSRPEPTIAQLVDLAVDGHNGVKSLALETLLDQYQKGSFELEAVRGSKYGTTLLGMYLDHFWVVLKECAGSVLNPKDLSLLIQSSSFRYKPTVVEMEAMYRERFGKLSLEDIRSLADIVTEKRREYWWELLSSDLINPTVARAFLEYPETRMQAARWILSYQRKYPNGRGPYKSTQRPFPTIHERQISADDLIPILSIPVLRAQAVKALTQVNISDGQLIQIIEPIKDCWPEDSRGIVSLIRWLLRKAENQPRIYIDMLRMPISGRSKVRIQSLAIAKLETWLVVQDLSPSDAKMLISFSDKKIRPRLTAILGRYRRRLARSNDKNPTQRLYEKLGGRFS